MKLILVRHGPTEWNANKRIQGRIDKSLSESGIAQVKNRQIPAEILRLAWYTSPLKRARQTAALMGIENPVVEPALIEMHWGDWEGEILKPLRKRLGDPMRENEARGIDFKPPNGESPAQVQLRLATWLRMLARSNRDSAAVSHKGIIRCIYAMACGWDMRGESPLEFDWDGGHLFHLDSTGELENRYHSISFR
jgi:broad specificity phosphatase PhoE